MNSLDKRDTQFVNSLRGQLIISQALCLAIATLQKHEDNKDYSKAEPSNKEDMMYLYENVFNIYKSIKEAQALL